MGKKLFLKAELIYKYFTGDEKIETLVMCKPNNLELTTTDQSLYEALGSIENKKKIDYNKLVKFLESVDIISFKHSLKKERKILMEERVKEIREYVRTGETYGRKKNKL